MNNKKDPMEQIIVDDLLEEAKAIDEEVPDIEMPEWSDDLKDKIKKNIYAQMEAKERESVYDQLSEDDRKALELGRKILENPNASDDGKVVYRRKRRKVFLAVAAVAMLVLAMGITSMGGAERVVEIVKLAIGEREIVKVNTDEDNYIVEVDKEDEAYQEIKDVFGVEAVKPAQWPEGTVFLKADIDEKLQTATLYYEYEEQMINYHISSHHTTSSWGIDVENMVTDNFYIELEETQIEAKEYKTPESNEKMFSAKYSYKGLDYVLVGTMERSDFEFIIKNLKFF